MTRITLSDRTAIEAGIYARQSLTEIAAKIGKTTIAVMFLKMSVSRLIPIGSLVLWAETDEVKQPF